MAPARHEREPRAQRGDPGRGIVVIGLDQSYTGFGYCTGGVSIKKGFPLGKFVDEVDRLWAIESWLGEQFHAIHTGVDLIVLEGYSHGAKFGREQAGELGWAVKRTVYDVFGKTPLIVPPTSLKKFVTGKGTAKKNEMLLGVFKRWGVEFSDDNQADAYALEQFGIAAVDALHWLDLPKYQQEALAAVERGPLAK